jgi:NAD-dependent SIR2 family protein deacetylase
MEDHLIDLRKSLSERRALLFVGAGVSMSVGMPSWRVLIEHILQELKLDPSILGSPDVTYQTIAEYFKVTRGGLQELGEWMKDRWLVSDEQIRSSRLHELIVSLDFPTIYTTNYDANLETAYRVHNRPCRKITTARDLACASSGLTLIVKYHGDFDDVASLVIAETDYFERLSFEAPLDTLSQRLFGRNHAFHRLQHDRSEHSLSASQAVEHLAPDGAHQRSAEFIRIHT